MGVSPLNAQKLIWAGCQVRPIPYPIYNPHYDAIDKSIHFHNNGKDGDDSFQTHDLWSCFNYNQLWIFSLHSYYETVFYIDHDFMILSNINYLFHRHKMYKKEDSNDETFLAAPVNHLVGNQFDSGIMIIQPNLSLFQEMTRLIKQGDIGGLPITKGNKNYNMNTIQNVNQFLNEKIFPNWFNASLIHRLEPIFNVPYDWTFHENIWLSQRSRIQIFHYTTFYKPEKIIANQKKYQITKYGAPLVYLWSLIMFFVTSPLKSLEEETRYVLYEVFHPTLDSDDIIAYIERMKRGGTRRRLESTIDNMNDEL